MSDRPSTVGPSGTAGNSGAASPSPVAKVVVSVHREDGSIDAVEMRGFKDSPEINTSFHSDEHPHHPSLVAIDFEMKVSMHGDELPEGETSLMKWVTS